MGIGNTSSSSSADVPRITSLPLMGIGNLERLDSPAWRNVLITPHGDWEHRNVAVAHGGPALITPHGDWEQVADRAGREAPGELITPHGDWERKPGSPSNRISPYSLPLMGIGNSLTGEHLPRHAVLITPHGDWELHPRSEDDMNDTDSLPLMGIGNSPLPCRGDSRRRGAHYPSWGLGTPLHVLVEGRLQALITPHGDWERDLRKIAAETDCDALITPHGDWERRHRRDLEAGVQLITPHGDWEPPAITWLTRSASFCSLPLMGIGNAEVASDNATKRVLITPHGDWERVPAPRRVLHPPLLITPHGDWEP